MKTNIFILFFTFYIPAFMSAQDSLSVTGQISGWVHYNFSSDLPLWSGARYLPAINYSIESGQSGMVDFEASANIYGSAGFSSDSLYTEGRLKPYRIWGRYSSEQLEIRAGLQKISFGSATLFRPLMWFDQLDPRDPLHLTDGVWGVLARYYFLNNANVWLWGLYGNEKRRGWDVTETAGETPEYGGRLQLPVPTGEMAFTYHHRRADLSSGLINMGTEKIPENRFGFDARLDIVVGLWVESSWTRWKSDLVTFNQEMVNFGTDYTFGIGNGLGIILEHIWMAAGEKAWNFKDPASFTGISLSYPIGFSDNLNAIVYSDWKNGNLYNFISWQRTWDSMSLYLMAYSNPENYVVPSQENSAGLFLGRGIQIMVSFNY